MAKGWHELSAWQAGRNVRFIEKIAGNNPDAIFLNRNFMGDGAYETQYAS